MNGETNAVAAAPVRRPAFHPLKIVYWGPGLSGKTTNLRWLHARLRPDLRGRLVTLDTPGERTIYFDCLPLELEARGYQVQLRLYTVPGQPRFRVTRRLVLQGVDALVFVWDSRVRRLRENVRSLLEIQSALGEIGRSFDQLPMVIQLNKRDLAPRTPFDRVEALLPEIGVRGLCVRAVATEGIGVRETLAAAARAALARRIASA